MLYQSSDYEKKFFCGNINKDSAEFKNVFKKDDILRSRRIKLKNSDTLCELLYMDGMVESEMLSDSIVRPLLTADADPLTNAYEICERILFANEVSFAKNYADAIRAVIYGDTVLLVDNSAKPLVINTKGWRTRGITEPADEKVLQGPREGFDEAAMLNLAMIRRKLLTPDFCVEMMRVGRRTETLVFVCYLGSLADEKTVSELKKRIKKIDIDGILDSNYITECIRDHKYSMFKTTGSTERPDIVAARLLEGRIAVVVDGTPVVLTLPYLFSENFQSDEDYYVNFSVAAIGRGLRWLCFFIAVSVPAIFLALTTFHLELLPTNFALTVIELHGGVPMPSVVECVILILVFEILKEAGIRTPQSLGHALSIVGGLVVGQAAVEARIISAPMLIAVALSGISGLMVPRLKSAVFYLRLIYIAASAVLGLYGFIIAVSLTAVRIFSLSSFGVDYTVSMKKFDFAHLKDSFFRAPWTTMKTRPAFNNNIIRKGNK